MNNSGALACTLGRKRVHEPKGWRELRKDAARLWHERNLILINPEDVLDPFNRQLLINEANRQYGKRSEN